MKKTLYLVIMLCLVDNTVSAVSNRIYIRKNPEADAITVSCNSRVCEVRSGETANFDNLSIGRWDGKNFSLLSSDATANANIESRDIPIVMESFESDKCQVYAPSLRILGETRISNFKVEFVRTGDNTLDITGTLITKCCDVSGSVIVNGGINLLENGILELKGIGGNNSLIVNGRLSSVGELKVDATENPTAKIINNGEISSGLGAISFLTYDFVNGGQGRIIGENALFQLGSTFQNNGILEFNELFCCITNSMTSIAEMGFNPVNFVQAGICVIHGDAFLACNLESYGETKINHLVFPYRSTFSVSRGQTEVDRVSGKVSVIKTESGSSATIGTLEDGADFVDSSGSRLTIRRLLSNRKSIFSAKSEGRTEIGQAETPDSFIYSDNGILKFSRLSGRSSALMRGTAELHLTGATDLTSLVSTDRSYVSVKDSTVNAVHTLSSKESSFGGETTSISSLNNRGKLEMVNTKTARLLNRGQMTFWENTSTDRMRNESEAIFRDGNHRIKVYSGSTNQSRLKVQCENYMDDDMDEEMAVATDEGIVLKGGQARVSVREVRGTGTIEANRQTYQGVMPTTFYTKGNVDVFTDYMPRPSEIPDHDGDFRVTVDMHEDYINSSDTNYGDTSLSMHMNGHEWINRNAEFIARDLSVDGASVFGNQDGNIFLERMLNVQAGQIFNISRPLARENGRWVDVWPSWWAHLVYYCPATYYSANPHTGIAVVHGDISLKSDTDTTNHFSSIYAGGTLTSVSGRKFDNTVANIVALGSGKSTITAPNIINACLSAVLRQGGAHTEKTAGWGWNRRTEVIYHHTAEWVNQSPGSSILSGGDLDLIGHTENRGSQIRSRGLLSGDINFCSVLENTAVCGSSGVLIEGDDVRLRLPFIFVHADRVFIGRINDETK